MQWNKNSGYYKNSMSNRAVEAYRDGEKPLSKWTKKEILLAIEKNKILTEEKLRGLSKWSKDELVDSFLKYTSWHHTSGAFNKTSFYSIDEEKLHYFMENKLSRPEIVKPKKEKGILQKPLYVHGEYKQVEYHPYSKWNKYIETWLPFINGVIKGDWLILPDGKRKKLSNVKITSTTKMKGKKKK